MLLWQETQPDFLINVVLLFCRSGILLWTAARKEGAGSATMARGEVQCGFTLRISGVYVYSACDQRLDQVQGKQFRTGGEHEQCVAIRAFNYVMNGVVLAMVGLGILNTILMRVIERRYESGLCSALGLRPVQLAVMVIGESLALTAISLALGLVLGLNAQHYFATAGLDLRWFFKSSLPSALVFDPIIYSRLSVTRIASSVGIVFLTATIISFYPALKAARTDLPGALKVF